MSGPGFEEATWGSSVPPWAPALAVQVQSWARTQVLDPGVGRHQPPLLLPGRMAPLLPDLDLGPHP